MPARSTVNDGWRNRLEARALTGLGPLWALAQEIGPLRRWLNRLLINQAALKMPPRPNPFSCKHDFTCWDSLTDKDYSSRHLGPAEPPADLPAADEVAEALFMRREGPEGEQTIPSPKSTVLFPYFAQWFTDGFLRSDRSESPDPARNDSNHDIDLIQIYGIDPTVTELLREGRQGRLKSQQVDGAEFPPYLFEDGEMRQQFRPQRPGDRGVEVVRREDIPAGREDQLFALGSDTGNLQVGFVLMSTLFLREHNRIAGRLADRHPGWSDERLFQTARNILTVILIRIVIDEYINHISPAHFRFFLDPGLLRGDEAWYRENWMAIEFNLLYQWHSLPPSTFRIGGEQLPLEATLFNTETVTSHGLGPLFEDATTQPAGEIRPFNTSRRGRIWEAVVGAIERGRAVDLASYNDYRSHCGFPRVTDFDQISGDPAVEDALRELYGSVDRIEFYPGLFAEDRRPNAALPPLIGRMVGVDAFSQALTNPLLAPRVFNERTFTPLGMRMIEATGSLSDLLHRNVPEADGDYFVSMTRRGWTRT